MMSHKYSAGQTSGLERDDTGRQSASETTRAQSVMRTLLSLLGGLLLLTALCLIPFLGKAFHIDDTLFLRAAEQIQKHPADFYGFSMNWYGQTRPMLENFENPPLSCYYLAAVALVGGWREWVLHLGYLLPALAMAWGTFALARQHCRHSGMAAALAVLTPAFLVSATTVMCDVMMLAFWVWAVVWLERGLQGGGWPACLMAGALCGLAYLTKFTGIALIPLLTAYGLCRAHNVGRWTLSILVPVVIIVAYEWTTSMLYGRSLLLHAAAVSSHAAGSHAGMLGEKHILGLSYFGGCLLPVLLIAPWLWSGRGLLIGLLAMMPVLLLYPRFGSFALLWDGDGRVRWLLCFQSSLFIASGLHLFFLAACDLWVHRNASSLLLFLWIVGIFLFATRLNWTVNGRGVLPAVPVVAILAVRRFELRQALRPTPWLRWWPWPVAAGGMVSLFLAMADCASANTGRCAARDICTAYQRPGKTLWFEGHWGFQYYMEKAGAKALDAGSSEPALGDILVVPSEAVNTFDFPTNLVRLIRTFAYTPNRFCSTTSLSAGAGFYAATAGPFPYSAGDIDPEYFYVFEVVQPKGTAAFGPMSPWMEGAVGEQFLLQRQKRHSRKAHQSSL